MSSLAKIIHESEETLEKAGFSREQAKAQVEVFSSFVDSQLATKRDLKDIETSLKRDIKETELLLSKDIKETEIKFDRKIAELKVDLIKWIIGVGVAQASIVLSVIKFVH